MPEKRPNRTMGGPHDVFWAYCSQKQFRLQRCDDCQNFQWPPGPACASCQGGMTWTKISGNGVLRSWCTFERQYYDECPPPWDVIYIELDEGPLFISNPGWILDPSETYDGLRVQVCFVECEDVHGSFQLPVFEMVPA